jgi:ATP-binding cassette subfamily C (CFTR/MRP) protein 1
MDKLQKRVGLTATIISQMKHLKISGLVAPVQESIQRMRIDELKTGAKFRTVIIIAAVIGWSPLCFSQS